MYRSETLRFLIGLLIVIGAVAGARGSAFGAVCEHVTIKSEVHRGGKTFAQVGVGSVLALNPGALVRYVVTPSHVVNGSDRIVASCGGTSFDLKLLGRSVTADVAVAKIPLYANPLVAPAFHLSGENVDFLPTRFALEKIAGPGSSAIRLVQARKEAEPKFMPVHFAAAYRDVYLNPIFGDEGAILASSGVIPGMSGSAYYVGHKYAGMVTKTLVGDSLSGIVPVSEIINILPALMSGQDPYGDQSAHLAVLEESLVERSLTHRLDRIHQLRIRAEGDDSRILKDECRSGSFAATSAWQDEAHGWGEGSGWSSVRGWGEGGGARVPGYELIQGFDINRGFSGEPPRAISLLIARRSDCLREGVIMPDGRRLVAIKNFRLDSSSPVHTLAVSSVDELVPLARKLGSKIFELIRLQGVFADENGPEFLCETGALHNTSFVENTDDEVFAVSSSGGKVASTSTVNLFILSHLEKPAASIGRSGRDGLTCQDSSHSLRLAVSKADAPVKADVEISASQLNGKIQIGSCQVDLKNHPKDFWRAEVHGDQFDIVFEMGVNIVGHGFIRLTPTRIDRACFKGTSFDSEKIKLGAVQWQAD